MYKKTLPIIILTGILLNTNLFSQISYLGKTSQFEDGTYGLTGTMSVCFSNDKRNIYVGSQYALAVFSYDKNSGNTEFVEAYRNDDDGNVGLYSSACIIVSPDDKYVYVSSDHRNCISLYKRDTNRGTLELLHIFYDTDEGFDGLRGAHEMGMSNDGLYIYIAAWNDNKISTFRRDTETGYISHIQSLSGYNAGGLSWPKSLKVSRDSRYVYVASVTDEKISVFRIDQQTGKLIYIQTVHPVGGQHNYTAMEISYDNRFLYQAGVNLLAVYSISSGNGWLTLKDLFLYDDPGISGMSGIYSLSVSPDDKNIYAVSSEDTSFVTFSRNLSNDEFQFTDSKPFMRHNTYSNVGYSTTGLICDSNFVFGTSYWECGVHVARRNYSDGTLTYDRFIYEGENALIDGLYNPESCCVDEQQGMAFVTTYYNGISIYKRNDTTGRLMYKNVANNQNHHTELLSGNGKSVLSKDGNYLYTFGELENQTQSIALAIFKVDHNTNNLILLDSILPALPPDSTGFGWPDDFAFSTDGKYLYIVSFGNIKGISRYLYNPQNGSLKWKGFFGNEHIGDPINNILFSQNGNYLFVWNSITGHITMLGRDKNSGALTYLSTMTNNSIGGVYLYGLDDVAISYDNKNLYAVYAKSDAMVVFAIDSVNNKIDPIQIFDYKSSGIDCLQQIKQVAVRSDGTFVYTTSFENNSLGLFYRDQSDGRLTFLKDYTEPENDFDGLDKVNGICIPTDDRNLYLISSAEEGVASYSIDLYLGPDRVICENDSALIDAGKGYATYLWSTGDTTQKIYAKKEGFYSVKTTDEFGFVYYDTMYLTVYKAPELDLGPDVSACFGDSVVLSSGYYGTNLWNTGDTTESITITNSGTYTDIVTDTNNCKNMDSVNVIFHQLPEVDLGKDITIRLDQTLIIQVDSMPGYDYLWFNGTTNGSVLILSDTITTNPLKVWVEVTSNFGCSNSDTVLVTLDPNFIYPGVIKVWPVPTTDLLNIKCNYSITNITGYDLNDKYLFSYQPDKKTVTLSTRTLSRGVYHLKISLRNGETKTFRILKL